MPTYLAFKLDLEFSRTLDWCEKELSKIITVLPSRTEHIQKGQHTDKTLSIIFVSCETTKKIMDLLKPFFSEFGTLNNAWCGECPRELIGMHGNFDPASIAAEKAWRTADFLTESKNS
jgi:hypothetical protein